MKITAKKVMIIGAVLIFAAIITASAGCVDNVIIDDVVTTTPDDIPGSWQSDESVLMDDGKYHNVEYLFNENNEGYKTSYGDSGWSTTHSFTWKETGTGQYEVHVDYETGTEIFTLMDGKLIDGAGNTYHMML